MEFGWEKKRKCLPSHTSVDGCQLTKLIIVSANIDLFTVYHSVGYFVFIAYLLVWTY